MSRFSRSHSSISALITGIDLSEIFGGSSYSRIARAIERPHILYRDAYMADLTPRQYFPWVPPYPSISVKRQRAIGTWELGIGNWEKV